MDVRIIKLLLIDDDEDYYVLARNLLAEAGHVPCQLDWTETYERALEIMPRNIYDLYLLDYHLGQHTGLELMRAARAQGCQGPVIILTGQGDHRIDLEAMQAGAADYLTKGKTDAALLERSIRYALEHAGTLAELRQRESQIAALYQQEQEYSRQLERAYADLRAAEGLRDDLMHMIVHDLRNPLSAITSTLEIVENAINNRRFDDSLLQFIARAHTAGLHMAGMIEDLLNVGKFEAGELRPALAPLHLPNLLAEKAETYRPQAEKENKSLSVRLPPDLPAVAADSVLIGRVIDNLLGNALKYTQPGGRIEVEAEQADQAVVVRVHDDGEGIPPEYHSRIFDKFIQVTNSTVRPRRKGVGLGLALCRLAVEAHGGKIWVESTPEQGSTFSFTLPIALAPPLP